MPLGDELRSRLIALQAHPDSAAGVGGNALAEIDRDMGEQFVNAATQLVIQSKSKPADVAAIGILGTLLSAVLPAEGVGGSAIELGCPSIVSRAMGRPVACDFTRASLAAGRWAAPTAWADWTLFHDRRLSRVLVHLGGLTGVSFVGADSQLLDMLAFDAGPGTLVLDALAQELYGRPFDADGAMAARGQVNAALLNELLANPFFHLKPPRLARPADWGSLFAERLMLMARKHGCGNKGEPILATATEMIARGTAMAIGMLTERPHEVILTGGGAMNIHLATRIRALMSPSSTVSVRKFGFDARAKQACCAGLLASAAMGGSLPFAPAIYE